MEKILMSFLVVLIILFVFMYLNYSVSEIKNKEEYIEFVKKLQDLKSFPNVVKDNSGIYIVQNLKNGKRKMPIGLACLREYDNSNLRALTFDENNNMKLFDKDEKRSVILNYEYVIIGMVCLLDNPKPSENSNVPQLYCTVFPLQLNIARMIMKNPNWNVPYLYKSYDLEKIDVKNAIAKHKKITVNGYGTGSGIGWTKTIKKEMPNETKEIHEYTVTGEPVDSYYALQTLLLGDQLFFYPMVLKNNKTIQDTNFTIVN